ncbi:MAG: hypothetical protein QM759_05115 [Terricaulis sp.]
MALLILIALQLVGSAVAIAILWRRSEGQRQELESLRAQLETLASQQRATQRGRREAITLAAVGGIERAPALRNEPPTARAARAWRLPGQSAGQIELPVSSPAIRNFSLTVAALAPALGFAAHVSVIHMVGAGVIVGAAMMLVSLNHHWRQAAWGGAFAAAAWAMLGLTTGAARGAPDLYCAVLPIAGATGLAHAFLRRSAHGALVALAPGASLALFMSAAALALGSQIGMVGAPGISFAAIVSCAAVAGASNIKLEPIHLAAFGATLIGLFVMSGQETAAIWFTPITAWAGALFLGIAGVRVPKVGARGAALASTGVIAPMAAISALYGAKQGLADPAATAGAFAVLALIFSGVIAAGARWHNRGVAALKLSVWVLGAGALLAASGAIFLALPPPYAAPAFAALALGYVLIEQRASYPMWRGFAAVATALACANAWASADLMLSEAPNLSPLASIGVGLAGTALISAVAGRIATRNKMTLTAGVLEGAAIAIGMTAAALGVRFYFSSGAPISHPMTFVEAGVHISVWLIAAMLIASRSRRDSRQLRTAAGTLLGGLAVGASALISVLWLTGYWEAHAAAAAPALFQHEGLGFALPALFFWSSWVFWRARGSNIRTRVSLGAGALLAAAFVTLEAMRPEGGGAPGTLNALVGALSFALAIVLNFAPGVAPGPSRRSYFEENFKRHRPREERRKAG